jgi:hypothetical protein
MLLMRAHDNHHAYDADIDAAVASHVNVPATDDLHTLTLRNQVNRLRLRDIQKEAHAPRQ